MSESIASAFVTWPPGVPSRLLLLLGLGVVVVEGLDLLGVEPGPYLFACLPLKLVGATGSPVRPIALVPLPGASG